MAAARHRLKCEQGATFRLVGTYRGSDGEPVDLTGCTARMQVRRRAGAEPVLLDLSSGDGITLGGIAGTVAIVIDADTTADLPDGRFAYDLEIESDGGEVTRLLEGDFVVDPEVTR